MYVSVYMHYRIASQIIIVLYLGGRARHQEKKIFNIYIPILDFFFSFLQSEKATLTHIYLRKFFPTAFPSHACSSPPLGTCMRNAYIRRHKLINKKTFIPAAQRFSGWKLEYALSGKGGKKVIPLTPLIVYSTWKCSGTHLFRPALLRLLLIVDTYLVLCGSIEFGIFSARANVDPLSIR